jgi:hypothetical protein
MRRSVLAVSFLAVLTAGCSASVGHVQGSNANFDFKVNSAVKQAVLEKQATDSLERSVGKRPDKVLCPGDLANPQPGSTMRCKIVQNDGTSIGLTIAITRVDGANVKFDVEADRTPTPAP